MEFRDLRQQYRKLKPEIDASIQQVVGDANFIMGKPVAKLEQELAEYVGVKHCISCGNGTDALSLALLVWGIKEGDAVFVPDFTFFASGEVVSLCGAAPVFVDVNQNTYNIDAHALEIKIEKVIAEGRLKPRVIVAVDLFGQPADYCEIRKIADKYGLLILEDAAQGFGGRIGEKKAGSFGDIATTSFFPAKPLGCYGDGGAIFTDNGDWAEKMESLRIHGKGSGKYDNIRIGVNSRLDTIQAAILLPKLKAFREYELENVNRAARQYSERLKDIVKIPVVQNGFTSSWAQYTIQLESLKERDGLQKHLKENAVPSMVYYPKPMHDQKAFSELVQDEDGFPVTEQLCNTVLSLPMHPYLTCEEQEKIVELTASFKSQK